MANLVSAGVSVTITDESFFIPAAAATVPLFFVATADEKKQPDNLSDAAGTFEHDVIRTVTSLQQSTQLYGVPRFLESTLSEQHHGDARNEYGLLALNQFLGVGNRAFVVRTNVNLNDDLTDTRASWVAKMTDAAAVLEGLVESYIAEYNASNGYIPSSPGYKVTVDSAELLSLANSATDDIWDLYSFQTLETDFEANQTTAAASSGYQGVNVGGAITGGSATGLLNDASVFAATITVDGVAKNITVVGSAAQTYTTLLSEINADLAGSAIISIDAGDLKVTSATAGATSTVLIVDAGVAGYQTVNVGGAITGGSATGLTNDATVYSMNVNVNGSGNQLVQIIGSEAQTYTALLNQINQDLTGATATIVGGNVVITSATTGTSSTVAITDVTLLAALTDFAAVLTALPGTDGLFSTLTTYVAITSAVPGVAAVATVLVYGNGYSAASTGVYLGLAGIAASWVSGALGATVGFETEWSAQEAYDTLVDAADDFQYTVNFLNKTSLGANDAARRTAIVTALQSSINSNQEIRSETYEYNLILCPGYHEVVDEMLALVTDIQDEALVLADTPMNMDPDAVVTWADSVARFHSSNVAYYYSHSYMSNLDGKNVLGAASGTALRTITYSDNVSELWFAPAGINRGLVTGVSLTGYASGTLGGPTTFVETNLSLGQRDNLYKYFTNVNPITWIPGRGIVVLGQKTSAPAASAVDRINVSRLIKYIKRQLRKSAYSFLFEPNDQLTRDNLKAVVDGFLGDIIVKRGLYDFVSICDDSNNTPTRIDNNEMYIDIALKPVKAAEFIYIPIRIVATGTQI